VTDSTTTSSRPPAVHPDSRRWKALALLCTANFMVTLDAQIVILALPSIQRRLHLAPGQGQWVLSGYLLAFGGLLLLGGRLADLLGRRRVFLAGTTLFGVSSLLCGLAWSGWALIAARAIQGTSAALMAPAALSILMTTFPEGDERNKALAYWSAAGALGATAALLIGGTLVGSLGWQWIFYLNVPVAVALLTLGPVLLLESRDPDRPRAYDPVGAITITAALVMLIAAIVHAPEAGWTSWQAIGLIVGAAVLLAVFIAVEQRSAAPLVPLRIFRSRLLVGGNLTMAVFAMLGWGTSFTVSGYAQQVLGFSPLRFGLGTTVLTLMAVVGAYAAQATLGRLSIQVVAAASMLLLGAGALLLTRVSAGGSYFGDVFLGLLVFGPGLGGGTVAAASAALSGVAEQEAGVASGTNTAAFQIGGALGTAIVTSVIVSQAPGSPSPATLTAGFQAGFTTCVVFAAVGLCAVMLLLGTRPARRTALPAGEPSTTER
jgi:EmrB/QacA subfamily drug resistance transporter